MSTENGTAGYSAQQAAKFKAANSDFPLRWHPRGGWCKKINGRVYYWGKVTPDEALARYHHDRGWYEKGEAPPAYDSQAATVHEVCNEFMAAKESLVESGELTQRSWDEYFATCQRLIKHFGPSRAVVGLHPVDFQSLRRKLAKPRGPVTLKNEMTRVKAVFKFAHEAGMIEHPVKYGSMFDPPKRNVIRRHRHAKGRQDFKPADIKRLLDASSGQLRGMILFGINAAAENTSVGELRIEQLDLASGWLDWPPGKTGALRRCWLWPETRDALREVTGERTEGLVFRTTFLNPWTPSAINHELRKLLQKLDLVKRGRNFYGLRRSFATIGNETGDRSAVELVMGHISDETMHDLYVQHVSDERIKNVCAHVRQRVLIDTAERKRKISK